jgi:hypothetical protein
MASTTAALGGAHGRAAVWLLKAVGPPEVAV